MTLKRSHPVKIVLTCDERNRLTSFFFLLVQIDRRINEEKRKPKPPKDKAREGTLKKAGLVLFCNSFIFKNYSYNSRLIKKHMVDTIV